MLRNNTLGVAYGVVQLRLCKRVVFKEGLANRSSNVIVVRNVDQSGRFRGCIVTEIVIL